MRVELVYAPGCPNAAVVRRRLLAALHNAGLPTTIEERVDSTRPSPSVLIDGTDTLPTPPRLEPACRLDLPTEEHLTAALAARLR